MKFSCQVEIKSPIEQVLKLYNDVDNLKEWQDGFVSHQHLNGKPGQNGAQSHLTYQSGKRKIELTETIIENKLPEKLLATYEHEHMDNTMLTEFTELDNHNTLYKVEVNYYRFHSIIPKLMAWLFPSMFKNQVQKWLKQFKAFVESKNE